MKNFLILFIFTALVGIFFKLYFPPDDGGGINEADINLSEHVVDSLIYFDLFLNQNKKYFKDFYGYKFNRLDKLFNTSIYDSISSRDYALGNLYFKRYFEFIAARDLLCEINNNLFNDPAMDRFSLPLIASYEDNEQLKNLFNDYIFHARKKYGLNKLINPSEIKKPRSSYEFEDYEIYNPMLFEYNAQLYLNKSIFNLNKYINSASPNKNRKLSSLLKLSLLYAKSNNQHEFRRIFHQHLDVDSFISLINNKNGEGIINFLDLEIIEYLVELELADLIILKQATNYKNSIKNEELKKLYLLKRELAGLNSINNEAVIYNCDMIDGIFYAPEIVLTIAEINFKNNDIVKAEDIVNNFWFKCTKKKQEWLYDNYPGLLLRSIRLGCWHGAKIPKWNEYFRDQYINEPDEFFSNLNSTIKLWVISTIGVIDGPGLKD